MEFRINQLHLTGQYLKVDRLTGYGDCEGTSSKVEYFGPELERMLCLSRTLSTVNEPKLSSFRCWRKLAISSLFLPDRTRAIVMCGLKGRFSFLKPRGDSSFSTCS